MQEKATVRLLRRGKEHPYVIEVTTASWRRADAALDGPLKVPDDLKQIQIVLDQANVKPSMTLAVADGTTEFVLKDSTDFELAVKALVLAGWLVPLPQAEAEGWIPASESQDINRAS